MTVDLLDSCSVGLEQRINAERDAARIVALSAADDRLAADGVGLRDRLGEPY